jgi:hypothetical protein
MAPHPPIPILQNLLSKRFSYGAVLQDLESKRLNLQDLQNNGFRTEGVVDPIALKTLLQISTYFYFTPFPGYSVMRISIVFICLDVMGA